METYKRPRSRCWNCSRRLHWWRKAWFNAEYGTTCWTCRCGVITVLTTAERAEGT